MPKESNARKFSKNLIRIASLSLREKDYENLDCIEIDLDFGKGKYNQTCSYTINKGIIGKSLSGNWERGNIGYRNVTEEEMKKEKSYLEFVLSEHFKKRVVITSNF